MPIPGGEITGSEIWSAPVEENNYEVIEIYTTRKRVIVSANTKETAESIAKDFFATTDDTKYDTLISQYSIEAKEVR